jgi:hypothetical protein
METAESSMFAEVIQDHLALKERNRRLEGSMPLERYKTRDPFENHPLFKTEEQARIEETMDEAEDGSIAAEAQVWLAETQEHVDADADDSLWGGRSRDFDWGD